jgi:hypothetical protein
MSKDIREHIDRIKGLKQQQNLNEEKSFYRGYSLSPDNNRITISKEYSDNNIEHSVTNVKEAKDVIDEIIVLEDYMDWHNNKYGGEVGITSEKIAEFVGGK